VIAFALSTQEHARSCQISLNVCFGPKETERTNGFVIDAPRRLVIVKIVTASEASLSCEVQLQESEASLSCEVQLQELYTEPMARAAVHIDQWGERLYTLTNAAERLGTSVRVVRSIRVIRALGLVRFRVTVEVAVVHIHSHSPRLDICLVDARVTAITLGTAPKDGCAAINDLEAPEAGTQTAALATRVGVLAAGRLPRARILGDAQPQVLR